MENNECRRRYQQFQHFCQKSSLERAPGDWLNCNLSETALYHPSLKNLDPDMTKKSETLPLCSCRGKSVHLVLQNVCFYLCEVLRKVIHQCMRVTELLNIKMMFLCTRESVVMTGKLKNCNLEFNDWPHHKTWNSEISEMATIFEKTVNPQMMLMIRSDHMAETKVLLSDWLECQSEEQDESGDGETEWSEEEDWSDVEVEEMSSENRELWDSFLNISDPYNPFHFSCPTEDKGKTADRDHGDDVDEPVPPKEKDDTECNEAEESDWSDEEDLEISAESRELWESFNSDPYNPLSFSYPTEDKVKASDSDHRGDAEEPVLSCPQKKDETECSEEEDSDWSEEGDLEMSAESRELWESFNSDPYNPLCFSCSAGVKFKVSEIQQNHIPSSSTASEDEEHDSEQSTKERAKKVCFSEEVTIHYLEEWDCESQAVRDGSCWMELARDRERFRRRVEKAGEIISPCLAAQHRTRVLDRLLNHSDSIVPDQ